MFVNDSSILGWVADDGRRRGDGAPVLVAHSTPEQAERHLDDPEAAAARDARRRCGPCSASAEQPRWVDVQRWSLARPVAAREEPYLLTPDGIGLCGDGWHAPSRVAGAWGSGRALGEELVRRLR